MKGRSFAVCALAAALALPLAAADEKPSAPAAAGIAGMYKIVEGTLVRAAEKMPEENYSFKPTPEVRSFGQILAHVADAQNFICRMAMGGSGAYSPDVEKGKTSKADIVAALKASNAGCEKVFNQTDAELTKPVTLFGMEMNRYGAATFFVAHDFEHYGNVVTYMRLKGLVPPSSEQPPKHEGPPKK